MARRRKNSSLDNLVELIALLPWWGGVVLALISYLWLHAIASAPLPAPAPAGKMGEMVTTMMWRSLAMFGQYLLPFVCLVSAAVSALRRRRREQLHEEASGANGDRAVQAMSWREFELLVGEHFRRQGFAVAETGGGGPDGGVDLVLRRGSDRYLVQCKHWRAQRVGVEPVRELYGLIAAQRAAGGFLVTSGRFTEEAERFAQGRELHLLDGGKLGVALKAQAVRSSPVAQGMPPEAAEPSLVPHLPEDATVPACPLCGDRMVLRRATRGAHAGRSFWGCGAFPGCRGTRPA